MGEQMKVLGKSIVLLGLSILMTGCTPFNNVKMDELAETLNQENMGNEEVTLETENGTFTVFLSEGWREIDPASLNEEADISLENGRKTMYAVILSESSEDYEDFDAFKNAVDFHDWLDVTDESEQVINHNGWNGTRYFITAKTEGINLYYVYDIVESEAGHFAQKIAWTTKSKKDSNSDLLEEILDSIKDVSN